MKIWTLLLALLALFAGFCNQPRPCVDEKELVPRSGLYYLAGEREPFSGAVCNRYTNGQSALKGTYYKGMRHGRFSFWNTAGRMEREEDFVNGRLTLRKIWYAADGQDGEQLEWWPNGRLKSRSILYKSIPFLETAWDSTGQRVVPVLSR